MTAPAIVIAGPSGVGKDSLVRMLRSNNSNKFHYCVSHTTRAPRPNEVDGVDYHFVSKATMLAAIERGEFVEYAHVHDNIYGTSKASIVDVQRRGTPLLILDIQGARQLSNSADIRCKFVFIKPSTIGALAERLAKRNENSAEDRALRLQNAASEIEASNEEFWDFVLINDDLEVCYRQLEAIAL